MSSRADGRHLAEVARRVRRQRLRWGGLAALVLVLLWRSHQGFFLYLGLCALGMGLLCRWLATGGLWRLRTTREVSATEVEADTEVTVAVRVTHDGPAGLPLPWLRIEDPVEGLAPRGPTCALLALVRRDGIALRYTVQPRQRGLYRVGPLLLTTSGPLGLMRRFHVERQAAFLTVFPRAVPLGERFALGGHPVHEVPRRRSLFEDPTRFLGVREYQPTDGPRRVHWRASARTGALHSRVYEPSVLGGLLLCVDLHPQAYAAAGAQAEAGDPLLELAVRAAASLAEHVLLGDQAVGLLANGGDAAERYPADWTGVTFQRRAAALQAGAARHNERSRRRRPVEVPAKKGAWQRGLLRSALARLEPADGMTLAELLLSELPRLPRALVLTAITPALTPQLAAALQAVRRAGIEAQVVWIGRPDADEEVPAGVSLGRGVPLRRVTQDEELARLGGARL